MTRAKQIRVKIERARISKADGMEHEAFRHLVDAVEMIVGNLHPTEITIPLRHSSAPSCARCKNDEHDKCGGPESGCGCAAENHGDPIQLRPADPPLPSGPPIAHFTAKSKDELCSQIAKVTGVTRADGEIRKQLDALIAATIYVTEEASMGSLNDLVAAALRLAGVIR